MRVHVALMPGEFPDLKLEGRVALVVDVFRATSMVVAAFSAGCARVIPVASAVAAREKAAAMAPEPVLLAGERGGDPIEGFDLGNSPLDCTADRVGGRTLVLTTTNGTNAMLKAGEAEAAAIAALTNVGASARWGASAMVTTYVVVARSSAASKRWVTSATSSVRPCSSSCAAPATTRGRECPRG